MTTTRHGLSVQQARLRRLVRATGTATPDQQPFPLPASPHSVGHCAGLHPEDQPYQSAEYPGAAPLSGHTRNVSLPTRQRLGHLATIGSCQAGAEAVIRSLLHHERWLLVDIRLTPWSYFPQWLGRTLAVQFAGRYLHLPALGQVYEGESATQPADLADAQSGVRHLVSLLEVGYSCLLLCGCPRWQQCHRALVSALVQAARPGLVVEHLRCALLPAQSVEVFYRSRGELGLSLEVTLIPTACAGGEETQDELVLVTPLTLAVTVPGRGGTITRSFEVVSWPVAHPPVGQRKEQHGATFFPAERGRVAQHKEVFV